MASGVERSAIPRSNDPSLIRIIAKVMTKDGNSWRLADSLGVDEWRDRASSAQDWLDRVERSIAFDAATGRTRTGWMLSLPVASPDAAGANRPTEDGFDIELFVDRQGIRGSFGGLEQEFSTVTEGMTWVRRALSEAYHLQLTTIGGVPSEWRLEPVDGDAQGSRTLSAGLSVLFAAFRSKTRTYRSNHLFAAEPA